MKLCDAELLFLPEDERLRFLPEGPYPFNDQFLSWVTIQHGPDATTGSVNVFDLRTRQNRETPINGRPGFAIPSNRRDTFVVGLERRIILFNTQEGEVREIARGIDEDVEGTIINDGCVFEGNLIFGTKDLQFREPKAGLYLWRAADRKLVKLAGGQTCSNGKFVRRTPAGPLLFDIDSPTRRIVSYSLDIPAGIIGPPRVVVDLRSEEAVPDGMVQTPGRRSLVVAMYHPGDADIGELRQYSLATGVLEATWRCDKSPRVTSAHFVRIGGRTRLIATTAIEGMPAEQLARCPNAGGLFIADTDFKQLPPTPIFPVPELV